MPIQRTIPNPRRFVSIRRAGIFTADMVRSSQYLLLRNTFGIERLEGLRGRGVEIQERLIEFMHSIAPAAATGAELVSA